MIDILIADDHSIVRKGIREILSGEPDITVAGEAKNSDELFTVLENYHVDLLILDINMPVKSGLELLYDLKVLYPNLPVLILSIYPENQFALRCLKAGAMGYLNKDIEPEEFMLAIKTIMKGIKYISPALGEKLLRQTEFENGMKAPHELLSDREFEVLRFLTEEKTIKEISEIMSLSIKTVSTYKIRLMNKLQLKSFSEILQYVKKHKLFLDNPGDVR